MMLTITNLENIIKKSEDEIVRLKAQVFDFYSADLSRCKYDNETGIYNSLSNSDYAEAIRFFVELGELEIIQENSYRHIFAKAVKDK